MTGWRIMGLAAAMALPCLPAWPAGAADPAGGRALYHGTAGFALGRDATSTRLPPAFAACASCHGPSGGGGTEGGIAAPPLGWTALTRPRGDLPPYPSADRVLRAVTDGRGRDGTALSPAMPRYRLSDTEARALLAYLKVIGTSADLPQGVTATEIRIGTALPLSGPAADTGRAVAAGLRDILDPVNARGGIHGRQVRLLAADTARAGARAAVQELVGRPVYAIAAGIWPGDDAGIERLLAERRVANLASLVVRPRAADAGAWDADLLPPLDEQQERLAAAMEDCGARGPRMALVIGGDSPGPGATRWWDSGPALDAALRHAGGTGCVGFGLSAAGLMAGVPPGWEQRIVLPMPAAMVGDEGGRGPWRRLGQAAGQVLVEVLSIAGAAPHERSALDAVPSLLGFEPLPGLALGFDGTRRYGWDAAVVAVPAGTDSTDAAQTPAPVPGNGG